MNADVHVSYWLTRELPEDGLADALDQLSAEERARYSRFVFANDRRDFAAAHLLLRRALSEHVHRPVRDWVFVRGPNGKPEIATSAADRPRLSFNLAHTDGLVACVVAWDAELGIDVERIDRCVESGNLARRYFSTIEMMDLERCSHEERPARFVELWTLKEAYLKATGRGLDPGIRDVAFTFADSASLSFQPVDPTRADGFRFGLFDVCADYRLAVALRDASGRASVVHVRDHGCHDSRRRDSAVLLRASAGLIDSRR